MQHEFREKVAQFQVKVQREHKPIADPSKVKSILIPRAYSSTELTKEERFERGLEYLAQAKELRKRESVSEVSKPREKQVYGNSIYKNYLSEREEVKSSPHLR